MFFTLKHLFVFFYYRKVKKHFIRYLFFTKFIKQLDPDPHCEKQLDPDPQKMNADPQPWNFLGKNLILCRKYPCKRQICLREVVDCVADVSQVAGQVGQAVPVPVSPQLWLAAGIFLKVLAVQ